MAKIKGDINCTHPVPLASAPVDETDVVRSVHVACLYRNDDSSVIEITVSLIYPHFTGCEIEYVMLYIIFHHNCMGNPIKQLSIQMEVRELLKNQLKIPYPFYV